MRTPLSISGLIRRATQPSTLALPHHVILPARPWGQGASRYNTFLLDFPETRLVRKTLFPPLQIPKSQAFRYDSGKETKTEFLHQFE